MAIRLTETQKRVVEHNSGALLVVAGPGSGKTRVLTERIRRILKQEQGHFRVLALTFTTKAAQEMEMRLNDIDGLKSRVFIGTTHSFCMEVLASRGQSLGLDGLPNIFEKVEDRRQILANAVKADPELTAMLYECRDSKERQLRLSDWLNKISELKSTLQFSYMVEDDIERRIYELYDAEMRACNAIDYDDLLLLTYKLFQERPKVADLYRKIYKYTFVDEAQDINEAQYGVITSFCGTDYREVMMVGDPRQAIYVWNGANPKFLNLFEKDFKATRVELNENFRCSKSIVEAACKLDDTYNVQGVLPVEGEVSCKVCRDESDEAKYVADNIAYLIEKGHPDIEGPVTLGRIAILARNRFIFESLERVLENRGMPFYKRVSSASFASESDLGKQFELALRLVANPKDKLRLDALSKAWRVVGISGALELDGVDLVNELASRATEGYTSAIISAIGKLNSDAQGIKFIQSVEELESFTSSVKEEDRELIIRDTSEWKRQWDVYVRAETGGNHKLSAFLSQVALGTTQNTVDQDLALLTIHSAKGMEFDVVFLIGMCEGVFPDYRAEGKALEEEQRSAFVAITRARRLLSITCPRSRMMPWGDLKYQVPSRYMRTVCDSVQ